jgi:hypothetical protein
LDIEECETAASAEEAELRYEPERSMDMGRRYLVTATVSLGGAPPTISFEDSTTVVTIDGVRCELTAQLVGADFAITARSAERQSFVGTRELAWSWDVRPRHNGNDLKLALTIQAIVVEPGRSVPARPTLQEAIIDVHPETQSAWRGMWDNVGDFLHDPIVAALVGALLLALGPKTYRKARAVFGRGSGDQQGEAAAVPAIRRTKSGRRTGPAGARREGQLGRRGRPPRLPRGHVHGDSPDPAHPSRTRR